MEVAAIMEIASEAVYTAFMCALPLMLAALVTGLAVAVFQAATQINESTLSFVPKLVAMFVVMLLCGVWILEQLTVFTTRLFDRIPMLVGP